MSFRLGIDFVLEQLSYFMRVKNSECFRFIKSELKSVPFCLGQIFLEIFISVNPNIWEGSGPVLAGFSSFV